MLIRTIFYFILSSLHGSEVAYALKRHINYSLFYSVPFCLGLRPKSSPLLPLHAFPSDFTSPFKLEVDRSGTVSACISCCIPRMLHHVYHSLHSEGWRSPFLRHPSYRRNWYLVHLERPRVVYDVHKPLYYLSPLSLIHTAPFDIQGDS